MDTTRAPIVPLDALAVKMRVEGRVENRADNGQYPQRRLPSPNHPKLPQHSATQPSKHQTQQKRKKRAKTRLE